MAIPQPTHVFRMVHLENIPVILQHGGMHAPNHFPDDGLTYKTIHDVEVQAARHNRPVPCGPGGDMHDYVPFYFGPLSPMLLKLKTGRVEGYTEGQSPLVYLVSSAQFVASQNHGFVFSDGHGVAAFTKWFDDLSKLCELDWDVIYARYWKDTIEDMDRMRRKQAEFLIHKFCPMRFIGAVGVYNQATKDKVSALLADSPRRDLCDKIFIKHSWYY